MKSKAVPVDQELYNIAKETVKARVKVWPSAYASGQLVSEYKKLFAQMYGTEESPYIDSLSERPGPTRVRGPQGPKITIGKYAQDIQNSDSESDQEPLDRWFREIWVNVCEKDRNNEYLPCGRKEANLDSNNYPYCRPMHRISKNTPRTVGEFSQEELENMCSYKRSQKQGVDGKPTRIYHTSVLHNAISNQSGNQSGGKSKSEIVVRELTDEERQSSSRRNKKYAVDLEDGKTVYFGHNEYEDFTLHKDPNRMMNYINRHQKREDWEMSGISTPGFWSRWLLWNKPSFVNSLKDIEKRFNVKIENYTDRND